MRQACLRRPVPAMAAILTRVAVPGCRCGKPLGNRTTAPASCPCHNRDPSR